ncbi:hypothetical protein NUACC21_72220 [Scytonema sp. NUACC21]
MLLIHDIGGHCPPYYYYYYYAFMISVPRSLLRVPCCDKNIQKLQNKELGKTSPNSLFLIVDRRN